MYVIVLLETMYKIKWDTILKGFIDAVSEDYFR